MNIKQSFPVFQHKSFVLYFTAQFFSIIGTRMHIVAEGWLVYSLTGSAYWIGVNSAISFLPATIFALIGGGIVDRFPRKKVFYIVQFLSFFLVLLLALLTYSQNISLFVIAVFTFLLGTLDAIDSPLRHTIIAELVPKKELHSAITLNSSMMNMGRVVGPALAGTIIMYYGAATGFLINGISFLAPIIAITFIKLPQITYLHKASFFKLLKEGLQFTFSNQFIKYTLLYVAVIAVFSSSYSALMPAFAEQLFNQQAAGLGLMYSSTALGAVLGGLFISLYGEKIEIKKAIFISSILLVISMLIFAFVPIFHFALLVLFTLGSGMAIVNVLLGITIQKNITDDMRGRVMSIYTFMQSGSIPIGTYQYGLLASTINIAFPLKLSAIAILIYSIWYYFKFRNKY